MHWIAPTEKDAASASLEKRLWDAADQFRANSGLNAQEYSGPILGLIFLRFAEVRFAAQRTKLEKAGDNIGADSVLAVGQGADDFVQMGHGGLPFLSRQAESAFVADSAGFDRMVRFGEAL